MDIFRALTAADLASLVLFAICWLGYEPLLKRLMRGGPDTINTHMTVVRIAWMRNMARRDARLIDSQLLGHVLNSGSFFASANLIIIAAAAGALFGGESMLRSVETVPLVARAPAILVEAKLGLIVVVLGRGLLSFIWAIRQMNYCLAAIGATPEGDADPERRNAFGEAAGQILNPALSSFSSGVRGYYFALAAASWLIGPLAFAGVTIGAVALLVWRQSQSRAAGGVRRLRELLETPPSQAA